MKRLLWGILALTVAFTIIIGFSSPSPSQAPEITIARPTWDTGWFQTEVFRELLKRLGYEVSPAKTYNTPEFYETVAAGEVDLWVNGWFPLHSQYLNDSGSQRKVETVGYQVRKGARQGYAVDLKTAQAHNITNLSDLQDPEVTKLFDRDGDGKADLIGCNVGWACADIINHHLQVYGLTETVEQVQGDYSPLMMNTVEAYQQGEPILFYTWTPNWTIGQLVPDEDIRWLEVPFASLPETPEASQKAISLENVSGCLSDPCQLGFPPNDIRVVANQEFLDNNPPVRELLELVQIPLEDISQQNSKMLAGEDREADIRRHAWEWIQKHPVKVKQWLEKVKAVSNATIPSSPQSDTLTEEDELFPEEMLTVVTKPVPPFVTYNNQAYTGFSIELWDAIAQEIGINYEIHGVNSTAKLLDETARGDADIAVGALSITSELEETLDFSHAIFESGLQILVKDEEQPFYMTLIQSFSRIFTSQGLYYGIGFFIFTLFLAGNIIWFVERSHNHEFPTSYWRGILEGIWWAAVTVTTVGYGDKTPKKPLGRLVGLIWMCSGYFVFAYFTATVTTSFTLQGLQDTIQGVEDLVGRRVATIEKSIAAEYLATQNLNLILYKDEAEIYEALRKDLVDAVVYDAPVLQHYARQTENQDLKVVGLTFQDFNYGMILPSNSPYRNAINVALLELNESGRYQEIYQNWFGQK